MLSIECKIYQIINPATPKLLSADFFCHIMSIARSKKFFKTREDTTRVRLRLGKYIIITSTFEPGEEGPFLLRIFTEKKQDANDEGLAMLSIGYKIYQIIDPAIPKPLSADFFRHNMSISQSKKFFKIREDTTRVRLLPGKYIIVTSNFEPGEEGPCYFIVDHA